MTPFSARTWADVLRKEGVIALIAVFLVYFVTSNVTASLGEVNRKLSDHMSDYRVDQQQIRYLLRTICSHESKSDGERAECFAMAAEFK